jgi:hypothetical protein
MSMLTELVLSFAERFDDRTYPTDIYFHLLDRIREASSAKELGTALAHALAWKDGKVRRDQHGPYATQHSDMSYRVEQTKPNTLGSLHEKILSSDEFFSWACKVRKLQYFDIALVNDLQDDFKLWSTIVMPVFLLHCLRPQIYPIVDRFVIVAFNILQPLQAARVNPKRITAEAYGSYHAWWLRLLQEAGISPWRAEINQLKDIDAGVWALGKSMSSRARGIVESLEEDLDGPAADITPSQRNGHLLMHTHKHATPGTATKEFKTRAIKLWRAGKTQANAIKIAADELGIQLKQSYIAYPGSHFDRWRKQGYEN